MIYDTYPLWSQFGQLFTDSGFSKQGFSPRPRLPRLPRFRTVQSFGDSRGFSGHIKPGAPCSICSPSTAIPAMLQVVMGKRPRVDHPDSELLNHPIPSLKYLESMVENKKYRHPQESVKAAIQIPVWSFIPCGERRQCASLSNWAWAKAQLHGSRHHWGTVLGTVPWISLCLTLRLDHPFSLQHIHVGVYHMYRFSRHSQLNTDEANDLAATLSFLEGVSVTWTLHMHFYVTYWKFPNLTKQLYLSGLYLNHTQVISCLASSTTSGPDKVSRSPGGHIQHFFCIFVSLHWVQFVGHHWSPFFAAQNGIFWVLWPGAKHSHYETHQWLFVFGC